MTVFHDIVDRYEALKAGQCGFCGGPLTAILHRDRVDVGGREALMDTEGVPCCDVCHTYWPQRSQDEVRDEAIRALDTRTPRGGQDG